MNHRKTARFLPRVGDGLIRPLHILRLEVGNVTLRPAEMPAQFVEIAPLRVFLPLDDEFVLLNSNGPFRLETDFRPKTLRNDRPRQLVHRNAEVVQFPQMNIRADRARLERSEQMFGLRLDDDTIANQVQRLFFRRALPAIFR